MTTVYFDLETGGLTNDKPNIQLAAIAVSEDWVELESIEIKIAFDEASADPESLKINHYDREVWNREARNSEVAIAQFDAFLCRHKSIEMKSKRTGLLYSVARLAGHNAIEFDMPRLKQMYGERFLPAHPIVLDTLQLALWYFYGKDQPESYKLEALLKHMGIPFPNSHDAMGDVRAAVSLAKTIVGRGST